ncbi:MAG TPA: LysR family transcriptional regulator [Luteibacter sp.]|uniref:LysR family transcriptional regulator n=1 Tax=Luteibacter sp. TaxID=1886636 RepID=UPI002BFC37D5|nr:LysR family transcriptional regulator [Luteibacter sp.]HVI53892.1 LysR family transcriptional regulator [Luteibacter sp.]
MSDRLSALRLFVRVARTGSFSRAGRELGLSQPSASRAIAALEADVGVALFTRSTRAVVLTDAGNDYLARIESLLAALDEADEAARGTGALRGLLRVALPTSLASREVVPRLPDFIRAHPALRIELRVEDQRQDLLREGIDVALRFGVMPDSTAVAKLVGANPRLAVAAPSYLAQAARLAHPDDLASHRIVLGPPGITAGAWSFERDGRTVSIAVESQLTVTSNEGAVAAAVAGLGIVSTGYWGCRNELEAGQLVPVLREWTLASSPLYAVFPGGRAATAAARAFIEYLAQGLGRHG